MVTPRVIEVTLLTCHPSPPVDRELRCESCGNRMFSSDAAALLEGGLRCSRCLGRLTLIAVGASDDDVS